MDLKQQTELEYEKIIKQKNDLPVIDRPQEVNYDSLPIHRNVNVHKPQLVNNRMSSEEILACLEQMKNDRNNLPENRRMPLDTSGISTELKDPEQFKDELQELMNKRNNLQEKSCGGYKPSSPNNSFLNLINTDEDEDEDKNITKNVYKNKLKSRIGPLYLFRFSVIGILSYCAFSWVYSFCSRRYF